ncbi:MAG: 7-carboxy-7-deazaguanine synthase QueE [Candidatus Omnitrophota bacterium]
MKAAAKISEIFFSIQGEGVYAGIPQIFVRFYGCNLNCAFCDTPGGKIFFEESLREILGRISSLAGDNRVKDISLTGGEPLLQADFINALAPRLNKRRHRIHLETNGTLPGELKKIVDFVDVVAMDVKLSSSTRGKSLWKEHREFLKIAQLKEVFVKVVITAETKISDFIKAVELVESVRKSVPFILQPVSGFNGFEKIADSAFLIDLQRRALARLRDVRIIPQLHKIMGLR